MNGRLFARRMPGCPRASTFVLTCGQVRKWMVRTGRARTIVGHNHHLWISVPGPWLVNSSSSTRAGVLPRLMMTTPDATARARRCQVSTSFWDHAGGKVQRAIRLRASFTDKSGISFFELSSTRERRSAAAAAWPSAAPPPRRQRCVGVDVDVAPYRSRKSARNGIREERFRDFEHESVDFLRSPTKQDRHFYRFASPDRKW